MSHAESEIKETQTKVPGGIDAALRYSEPTAGSGGAGAGEGAGRGARREGPYVSRGLEPQKSEPERPAEPQRSASAALHRAHEAAYDPSAPAEGFVGPSSFGLGVYGGAPLSAAPAKGGDPHNVPAGGRAVWTGRGAHGPEVGPPPAHPLSVASPLGLGVAGGAWNAPEPGGAGGGGGVLGLASPVGNLSDGAGAGLGDGPQISLGRVKKAVAPLQQDAGNLRRGAGDALRGGAPRDSGGAPAAGAEGAIASAWQGVWQ